MSQKLIRYNGVSYILPQSAKRLRTIIKPIEDVDISRMDSEPIHRIEPLHRLTLVERAQERR